MHAYEQRHVTWLCTVVSLLVRSLLYTVRSSIWACIGNPKLEQETIEGTHAQETPAYQRRPTTLHAVQGSNPTYTILHVYFACLPLSPLSELFTEALVVSTCYTITQIACKCCPKMAS